jgi:ATPase subunit of ABC transporter with duplicated ATPase domains
MCAAVCCAPAAPTEWDGGLVLVSHDFRLISQVATSIWEVRGGGVHVWKGDIVSYKKHLRSEMEALQKRKDMA